MSRLSGSVGVSMSISTCKGVVPPVVSPGAQAVYTGLIESLWGASRPGDATSRSILFREAVEMERGLDCNTSELEGSLKSVVSKLG